MQPSIWYVLVLAKLTHEIQQEEYGHKIAETEADEMGKKELR